MSEQNKKIEDKDLEKVTGGRAYWDGPVVRFSSEEGDWHAGDKFMRKSPSAPEWEYLVLQDNGVFINNETGHKYQAKRYRYSTGAFQGDTEITDYSIMMRYDDIEFVPQ